ncbi:MAG: sugar ABC transporter permease, partial [Chloroflexota bacterium]
MDRPTTLKRYSALAAREDRWGFLLIAPFCALFFVFKVIPAIMAVWLTLAKWNFATNASTFVGLANVERLLGQSIFWQAML